MRDLRFHKRTSIYERVASPREFAREDQRARAAAVPTEQWMTELGTLLQELESITAARDNLAAAGRDCRATVGSGPPGDRQQPVCRLAVQARGYGGARPARGPDLFGLGHEAGLRAASATLEIAALLHDIGIDRHARSHPAEAGRLDSDEAAVMRRARHDEPGDPPPQLHLAGDPGDRREHRRLVRRQPRPASAIGGEQIPAGRADDRHGRGLRRHDHRPRLPARHVAGAGDGRIVRLRGHAIRPEAGASSSPSCAKATRRRCMRRWPAAGCGRSIRRRPIPIGSSTASPSPAAAAGDRRAVPGQAAGQHVRRGGVRRCRGPDRAVEPRRGTADGHRRRQHPRPAWQPEMLGCPTKRGAHRRSRLPRARGDPLRRAIAAAADDSRAQRAAAWPSMPTPFPSSARTALRRGRCCCCTTPRRKLRWSNAARACTRRPPTTRLTQVANRAEFDRVHAMFVAAHQQQQVPCSLIMCDLDRFKLVNDTYGHQAGDDGDQEPGLVAEECLPARRPGGPLRRRGVRHALRRLRQRHGHAAGRTNPQGAEPDAPAEDGRPDRSPSASASPKSSPAIRPKPCSAAPTAHC